ncbi:MAG TPA: endonuclease, partial [Bacteroidetes bacterium]|nr:endonuclease [Bacteroidota bacterium]
VADTFFYTNCTPQHQRFNPRSWLNLEDYILDNAGEENSRVCVFTGPVFAPTDKIYRGFQIPEAYWKVVAVAHSQTGRLSVSGYIVTQQDFMNDLEFVYGEYQTFHVPLKMIEDKTGLDFGLIPFDVLGSVESAPVRVVRGAGDIMI